jgi:hypothetical protein
VIVFTEDDCGAKECKGKSFSEVPLYIERRDNSLSVLGIALTSSASDLKLEAVCGPGLSRSPCFEMEARPVDKPGLETL